MFEEMERDRGGVAGAKTSACMSGAFKTSEDCWRGSDGARDRLPPISESASIGGLAGWSYARVAPIAGAASS